MRSIKNCSFIIEKRIVLIDGFNLDFEVVDSYEIKVKLTTPRDPTLVETGPIVIGIDAITRNASVDEASGELIEGSLEPESDFINRVYLEALSWSRAEIEEYRKAEKLATALEEFVGKLSIEKV